YGTINGVQNCVDISDLRTTNDFTWATPPPITATVVAVRPVNTNPALDNVSGNGTYAWPAVTKIYTRTFGFAGTDSGFTDDLGAMPYLNIGASDMGDFLNTAPGNVAAEFRTSAPHGFKTGDCPFTGTAGPSAIPCTGATNQTTTSTQKWNNNVLSIPVF